MIKGLDDDEVEYLDLVDRTKLAVEHRKNLDEERELKDYRNRVASLQEKSLDQRLQAEISVGRPKLGSQPKHSQQKLLKGVVIKKSETRKRKLSEEDAERAEVTEAPEDGQHEHEQLREGALTCIGILPGLGCYNNSSDSEMSSESEQECHQLQIDLLGRKIIKKKPDESN